MSTIINKVTESTITQKGSEPKKSTKKRQREKRLATNNKGAQTDHYCTFGKRSPTYNNYKSLLRDMTELTYTVGPEKPKHIIRDVRNTYDKHIRKQHCDKSKTV